MEEHDNTRDQNPPIILYDEEDVLEGLKSCSKSLLGRIVTQKPIHTNNLHNALSGIWCQPKGFRIEEVAQKTFQFFFEEESDAERIRKGSPWLFRNSWLILRGWERGQNMEEVDFSNVLVRMQIWGLPSHCQTVRMGFKIGACMGRVQEVEIFETKEKGIYLRCLIEMDVTKPLLGGISVGSKEDGVSWISFQYERLPQFCYACGLVGHEEELCKRRRKSELVGEGSEEEEWGPWLRASQFG
ncbi:Zinc knuckle CX2CX4HX4C [Sesbania bispinosa]|nr:Zinc knuckle CX2CX4HX4C [Sesbania bispinosa]